MAKDVGKNLEKNSENEAEKAGNVEENVNVAAAVATEREKLESTTAELEREIAKLRDPTVHASIMYSLMRERESTNMILKNILAKLDALDEKLSALKQTQAAPTNVPPVQKSIDMLPDVDRMIISYIKEQGAATAEDIQKMLRYRGKNAACARLSRLADLGFLIRQRAGRITRYICAQ
jgi:uncharacterized membrane protein